jgi:glucose-6-phosphate-specific signal transduction histidine kinase
MFKTLAYILLIGGITFHENHNFLEEGLLSKGDKLLFMWRGFYTFAILIGFILFAIFRKGIFVYFILLNIGLFMVLGNDNGIHQYIFDDASDLVYRLKILGYFIINLAMALFLDKTFNISSNYRKIWKFILFLNLLLPIVFAVDLLAYAFGYHLESYSTKFALTNHLVINVFLLLLLFRQYRRNNNANSQVIILSLFYVVFLFFNVVIQFVSKGIAKNDNSDFLIASSLIFITGFIYTLIINSFKVFEERAELYSFQKRYQRDLISSIVSNQELEMNELSKSLHDLVGGNLSLIKSFAVSNGGSYNLYHLNDIIHDIRIMSHQLSLPEFDTKNFIYDIKELGRDKFSNGVNFNLNIHNWPSEIEKEKILLIYRVLQFLIKIPIEINEASDIHLSIVGYQNIISVTYEDDSKIDFRENISGNSILNGIRNRLFLLNSFYEINYSVDLGTNITITFPLRSEKII